LLVNGREWAFRIGGDLVVGRFNARALTVLAAGALVASMSGWVGSAAIASAARPRTGVHAAGAACALGPTGSIKHVIYIQFDNVHLA
jgi:hypothetical protein